MSQHLVQVALVHLHTVGTQHIAHQRRTLILAHRWQLGLITYQHHTTILPTIHKLHQVVQQASATKRALAIALVGNHRCLIYHKQGIAVIVEVQIKGRDIASRFLTIDTTMDGVSRMTSVECKHLCCTACWGQQNHLLFQHIHRPYDGTRQGGFTRTCRTTQNHHHMVVAVGHKEREHVDGVLLFGRRHHAHSLSNAVFKLVANHFGHKGTKN